MARTFIIAEVSANHNGSIELAKKTMLAAKEANVEMRVCTQCGICASVCNTGVIQQNKFGVYMINKKECVGCYMCVGFCPEQVMYYVDGRNEPGKCTACGICVKACPVGALSIQDV